MRNALTIAIVALVCLICPINPLIGLAGYYWFALMRPDILSWAGANNYSFLIALVTLITNAPRAISNISVLLSSTVCRMFLLFLLAAGLSCLFAVQPGLCLEPMSLFGRVAVMALVIPLVVRTMKDLHLLFLVVAGSIGLLGAKYGLGGLIGGGARYAAGFGGMMSDNNTMALAFAMAVPLCWFARMLTDRRWVRLAFAAGSMFNAAAVVFTHSRGGVLAVGAAMLLMTWRSKHRLVAAVFIFGSLGATAFLVRDSFTARMSTITSPVEEASANSRLVLARSALSLWLDYPLFGVGFTERNEQALIGRYVPAEYSEEYGNKVLHNTYAQVLTDTGLIGFVSYVALFFGTCLLLGASAKRRKAGGLDASVPLGLQTSLAAYLVGSTFLSRVGFDLAYVVLMIGAAWLSLEKSEALPSPAVYLPELVRAAPTPAPQPASPPQAEPQEQPIRPRTARARRAFLRRDT